MAMSADARRQGLGARAFAAALRPAVSVMNRLKYPQKFALVSLLFLLPMGLLIEALTSIQFERVEFTSRELHGTEYLRSLRGFLPLISQARFQAKALASGEVSGRPALVRSQASMGQAFEPLRLCEERHGHELGTSADFGVLRRNLTELLEDHRSLSPSNTDALYSELLVDARTLIARVGDGSNLILDPELDSYYLCDLILNKIPEGIELLDRAGRLSSHEGNSSELLDDSSSLATLLGAIALETQRSVVVADRSSTTRFKRVLIPVLRDYLDSIQAARRDLVDSASQKRLGKPAVDPERIATAIENGGELWDAGVEQLDGQLHRRIERDLARLRLIALGVVLSLALVAYIWTGFYRAVMGTVSALAESSQRLVGGDMTGGQLMASRDEMGIVIRSFNEVASRLRLEWEQAREESVRAREAEHLLRDSEERSRLILDSSMDAVAVLDKEGIILNWNPQAEVTFGWSREAAMGRRLAEIAFPAATREIFQKILASTLLDQEQHVPGIRSELAMTRQDGREVPIELTITPVFASGEPAVSVFFRDLTDRNRAEEEIQRAETLRINKESAEAASRAKSEFLANMSHEIRTPMNGIIGMTELTLDTDLTLTQREYLSMVKSSADALLIVINDILDFSKIEAGKIELDEEEFDLHEVLGDTLKPLAVRSHAKGLELACRIAPQVPQFVRGDHHRLQQILINLVGNAIKFTESGEVVVSAEIGEEPGFIQYSVKDTGIGIPATRREAIFEAFEQADGSTTRCHGGTGLGLAISQRLVHLMGGRLWVESEVGEGSTFHFTVFLDACDGESVLREVAVGVPLQGYRALIVDDNSTNRVILEELTKLWGMESQSVDCAADALIALALEAPSDPFEIVLLDWMMPGMNGVELARRIGEEPLVPKPRVILLSSGGVPPDYDRLGQGGIDACLLKPVKRSELLATMRRVLDRAPAGREGKEFRPPSKAPDGPRLKVLLAEDNPVNQALAAELLRKRSHEVTVVKNGREALEAIASHSFDLVLMDVQMPELDGLGATAAIRESERGGTTRLPIIALTAFAMKGDRERCLDAGCDGYVSKPIRSDILFAAIKDVLDHDQPRTGKEPPSAPSTAESLPAPRSDRVIDWSRFSRAVDGDLDLATRMIELFLEDCPGLEAEVCAAIREGDALKLRAAAHALKGSASNFAADAVVRLTERLEHMGRAEDLSVAAALLEPWGVALMALRAALADPPPEIARRPILFEAGACEPTGGVSHR